MRFLGKLCKFPFELVWRLVKTVVEMVIDHLKNQKSNP